jgi:transcriptional regulator with XRE-family HTH domain
LDRVQTNVRRLRHAKDMTQEDLASDAGIARAYLGRLETQGRNISINVLDALADALDVDPRDLLKPEKEWDDENDSSDTT